MDWVQLNLEEAPDDELEELGLVLDRAVSQVI
jgi:hypothetical protein